MAAMRCPRGAGRTAGWGAITAAACSWASTAFAVDVVDPAILEAIRETVVFRETFDELPAGAATGAERVEGIVGGATAVDGRYVRDVADVLSPAAGTVSWWARHDFDTARGGLLLAFDDRRALFLDFFGATSSDPRHRELGHFYSPLFPGTGALFARYAGGVREGVWHHVAVGWNADRFRVDFDGRTAAEATGRAPFSDLGAGTLALAGPRVDGAAGRVALDELRIHNRSLTVAEVAAYVLAVRQGGAVRALASRPPHRPADRHGLAIWAAYRLSDASVQVHGDLSTLAVSAAGAAGDDDARRSDVLISVNATDGRVVATRLLPRVDPYKAFHATIPVGPLADGTYAVTLSVGGRRAATTFDRVAEPWENNGLGVGTDTMDPWPPLKVDGRTVACWGRRVTLGPLGLPDRIVSTQPEPTRGAATRDLLARPVRLVIETPAGPLAVAGGPPRLEPVGTGGVAVVASGTAGDGIATVTVSGTVEFDGFHGLTIRVEPRGPLDVTAVRLEVALPDALAVLFDASAENMRKTKAFLDLHGRPDGPLWDSVHAVTAAARGPDSGRLVTASRDRSIGTLFPHVWLGDDDRGIACMIDSTRGWVLDEGRPCQDLVRSGGATILRIHLVNAPATLRTAVEARFAIQATPVRPRPPGGSWKKLEWYGWGHFDEPALAAACFADYAAGRRPAGGPWYRSEEARAADRWWRYFCFETHRVPDDDPEFGATVRRHRPEWDEGLHVASHRDFLLWAYRRWHDEAGMDGIYYDNTYARPTISLGSGLAWQDDRGRVHGSFTGFADRELLKRVRRYFLAQGPTPLLKAHVTDAPIVGYLGLADFWMDGENGGWLSADQETEAARAGQATFDFVDRWYSPTGLVNLRIMLGRQWGPIPQYLYTWGLDATQSMLGMFDIDNGLWSMHGVADDFGRRETDVEFLPWWGVRRPVTLAAAGRHVGTAAVPDTFVTAWRRTGRLRVLVSNLGDLEQRVDLTIDPEAVGLPADAVARDDQSHDPLEIDRGVAGRIVVRDLPVGRHAYRAVLLTVPGAVSAAASPGPPGGGQRVERLCDDFRSLRPEWKPVCDARRPGPPFECHLGDPPGRWYGLWADRLRISGGKGRVLALPMGVDACDVRVRVQAAGELWNVQSHGFAAADLAASGPSLALDWGDGTHVTLAAGGRAGPDGALIRWTATAGDRTVAEGSGPRAASVTWLKFGLRRDEIIFAASTDGLSWKEIHRQGREAHRGPPQRLLLGMPQEGETFPTGDARAAGMAFFDDLETTRGADETGR